MLKSGLSFNITICTLQGVQAVGMGKEAQNLPVAAKLCKKAQVVCVTHISCMRNTYKLYELPIQVVCVSNTSCMGY